MASIFTIIYVIWGVSEFLISVLLRPKKTEKANKDNNSLTFIWLGILISLTLSVYISATYNFSISVYESVKYVGLALIVIGIVLRLIIIKSLGKFFTAVVTIKQDHKLKTDGFYHFLRHPSYSASLLSFIGFGISLNNWVSLVLVIVMVLIVFINRIKTEEKALIEFFGQDYLDYMKSTKALLPFIY